VDCEPAIGVRVTGSSWRSIAVYRRRWLLVAATFALATAIARLLSTPHLLFGPSFLLRAAWAGLLAAAGFAHGFCGPRVGKVLARVTCLASAAFLTVILQVQGGFGRTMYPWTYGLMVVLPMAGASIFRDDMGAAAILAISTLCGGVLEVVLWRSSPQDVAMVLVQLSLVGVLTLTLTRTHWRLQREEFLAAIARDEAELQRTHAERAERELRLRDEFIGVVAHQLRTPMTPLALWTAKLEMVIRGSDALSTQQATALASWVDRVTSSVKRLQVLVEQLVALNAVLAGTLVLHAEPQDLSAVVRGVVEQCTDAARRAASPVTLQAPGPVPGSWDGALVGIALRQIMANAIAFGAGRPIDVSVRAGGRGAAIVVRDHGSGIACEDQERIFRRFERAAPPTQYGGLGVGLWIAREAARTHHGDVSVESAIGRGATFTLTLASA
jgi:signal transduction histidine kinase